MKKLRLGIVGTGMIASVIAKAVKSSEKAVVTGVASRTFARAQAFAEEHGIADAFESISALLQSKNVDAIYVATPTAGREEICIDVLNAGKHLISEKPFLCLDSVLRISEKAKQKGLAFMDATHFTHHSRTAAINTYRRENLGDVKTIRTSFYFPFMDRENIRFNPEKEPSGAIGDMAWYNMRAIVEFMQSDLAVRNIVGSTRVDSLTKAVIGGSGLIEFTNGRSSMLSFGYDAAVCQMDLDIICDNGLLQVDDFVLDWKDGFAFDNPEHTPNFIVRQGMMSPTEFVITSIETEKPQALHMIEAFYDLVFAASEEERTAAVSRAINTQALLDSFVDAVTPRQIGQQTN